MKTSPVTYKLEIKNNPYHINIEAMSVCLHSTTNLSKLSLIPLSTHSLTRKALFIAGWMQRHYPPQV
jgi:hypothetical protein